MPSDRLPDLGLMANAKKIAALVPKFADDWAAAQMVLHLAEAYAHLATERPQGQADPTGYAVTWVVSVRG